MVSFENQIDEDTTDKAIDQYRETLSSAVNIEAFSSFNGNEARADHLFVRVQTKRLPDKRAKNTDKKATDKKADKRAKIILIKSSIIIT